ncbi:MAG: DUF695 domain-containing protein [Muribaculaceae bacterium]|nr:DUF695 domain-containing protein [Muribaculaceae bacterium]
MADWWTSPASAEDGKLIMVTGRRDVRKFRENPRFNIRVEVSWKYVSGADGMPSTEDSAMMEEVQERLTSEFDKDPVAVLTGVYTGDGERNWVFYTLSTHIFGKKLNQALESLPLLPLEIYAENDPDWAEYDEMCDCEIKLD